MIPEISITAWSLTVPWTEPRQVEQDLIISRVLVEIFNHGLLGADPRFRGGTALNKIVFPEPLRYSEDIDLVRTSAGSTGSIPDALRDVLEPWLGHGRFAPRRVAPKLRFRVPTADDPEAQIRLKVEINIVETEAFDPPVSISYSVENPWFPGSTTIASFSPEELLATKLRALLQRDKGRGYLRVAEHARPPSERAKVIWIRFAHLHAGLRNECCRIKPAGHTKALGPMPGIGQGKSRVAGGRPHTKRRRDLKKFKPDECATNLMKAGYVST